jgi:hypothetical protein
VKRDDDYSFEIDVPVRNEWSNVTLLVTSVQNCFHAMFGNVDGSHTVAMVAGELLENAIKYGDWSRGRPRLRLVVAGSQAKARVTVENPALEDSVGEVQRTLDWLQGFKSVDEAFRARLIAIAQTADPDVSKLGLVRIAYEGRCVIQASYEKNVLRVTAEVAL